MARKIIISFAVAFFMALILFTGMMFMTNTTEVYSQNEIKLEIKKPAFFTLAEPDNFGKQNITLFGLPLGSLTITERQLDNGTTIVFEHLENSSWLPFVVSINTSGIEGADVRSWNPDPIIPTTDAEYGKDLTTNPFGVLASGPMEILQSNVFIYRDLTLGNGELVKELRHEIKDLTIEENRLLKGYWLPPKHQADSWFILAPEPFFSSSQDEEAWVSFAAKNPQQRLNWLTPEGPVVKMALTEDLRTELAFQVAKEDIASTIAEQWQAKSPAVYFESILQNAEAHN